MDYGVYLQDTALWKDYTSQNEVNIDEDYRQKDIQACTKSTLSESCALIMNNSLMKNLGVTAESCTDLLQPALKSKLVAADPTKSSSA